MIQRDDDTENTVINRLSVFMEQTKPLLSFYEKLGYLVEIDGDQHIDEVFKDIDQTIGGISR